MLLAREGYQAVAIESPSTLPSIRRRCASQTVRARIGWSIQGDRLCPGVWTGHMTQTVEARYCGAVVQIYTKFSCASAHRDAFEPTA